MTGRWKYPCLLQSFKSAGIKVYSSDIYTDVFSTDQIRANHLLKVT